MQVRGDEERVVVEHLLEVGHHPAEVDRVAVEAAADHVVHASRGHAVERLRGELRRDVVAAPEQELDRRGGRELRRRPPAAELVVEAAPQRPRRLEEERLLERLVRRRPVGADPDVVDELAGGPRDLVRLLAVGLRDGEQHLRERGQAVARLRREVGAAEERLSLGGQEDGHRPAAGAVERDDCAHVDVVDVGPLLAVDLDVDEVLVHDRGGRLALERLALHHVAPVAGGVADREQDRPVELARTGERLLAPGVPVDRVLRVLEQVRAGLAGEAVHRVTLAPGGQSSSHSSPAESKGSSPSSQRSSSTRSTR